MYANFYVTYDREYMIIDDVRISIDKNIKYENFKTNYYQKKKIALLNLRLLLIKIVMI